MDLPDVIELCLSLPAAEETTPFGPEALVYKVGGKMFAVTVPEDFPARINLKCDPQRSIELREDYKGIQPGWHMNKKHWNTVMLDGTVPPAVVRELVQHSYELVVEALPRNVKAQLTAGAKPKKAAKAATVSTKKKAAKKTATPAKKKATAKKRPR